MGETNRVSIEEVSVSTDHYIDGKRIGSPTTFESRSPLDWSNKLADVARGDANTADQAVTAATAAFPGWADMTSVARGDYLNRLAALIEHHAVELATVECLDMAMLYSSLEKRVVARAARNFRVYGELATQYE